MTGRNDENEVMVSYYQYSKEPPPNPVMQTFSMFKPLPFRTSCLQQALTAAALATWLQTAAETSSSEPWSYCTIEASIITKSLLWGSFLYLYYKGAPNPLITDSYIAQICSEVVEINVQSSRGLYL